MQHRTTCSLLPIGTEHREWHNTLQQRGENFTANHTWRAKVAWRHCIDVGIDVGSNLVWEEEEVWACAACGSGACFEVVVIPLRSVGKPICFFRLLPPTHDHRR